MRRIYQIFLPLLSLFLVRVDLTDLFALKVYVEVVNVIDGDTLVLKHHGYRWNFRLSKIDAPELKQPYLNGMPNSGEYSRSCLIRLLKGQNDFIMRLSGFDIYRRALGDLNDLNYSMIQQGCAGIYPYARFESRSEKWRYIRAEMWAKKNYHGLWGRGGILLPKIWRSKNKKTSKQV